jgi:hypothetical protein
MPITPHEFGAKWKLRRLYESDTQGLLNDGSYTLLERCPDILSEKG